MKRYYNQHLTTMRWTQYLMYTPKFQTQNCINEVVIINIGNLFGCLHLTLKLDTDYLTSSIRILLQCTEDANDCESLRRE